MTEQGWTFENDEEGLRGVEREQWLIRDLDTDNHDIIGVVPKTGDEEYDDRVTYANLKLMASAKAMYSILHILVKMVEDGDWTTVELDEARAVLALVDSRTPLRKEES